LVIIEQIVLASNHIQLLHPKQRFIHRNYLIWLIDDNGGAYHIRYSEDASRILNEFIVFILNFPFRDLVRNTPQVGLNIASNAILLLFKCKLQPCDEFPRELKCMLQKEVGAIQRTPFGHLNQVFGHLLNHILKLSQLIQPWHLPWKIPEFIHFEIWDFCKHLVINILSVEPHFKLQ